MKHWLNNFFCKTAFNINHYLVLLLLICDWYLMDCIIKTHSLPPFQLRWVAKTKTNQKKKIKVQILFLKCFADFIWIKETPYFLMHWNTWHAQCVPRENFGLGLSSKNQLGFLRRIHKLKFLFQLLPVEQNMFWCGQPDEVMWYNTIWIHQYSRFQKESEYHAWGHCHLPVNTLTG